MALNYAGTLLATTSEKGTLIRIFSTDSGLPLQELRRGRNEAIIFSLCFDMKGQWLACSSDRSTIHIFTVNIKLDQPNAIKLSDEEAKVADDGDKDGGDKRENKKSKLTLIKTFLPKYFDSEWSYGRFKVPGDNTN